MNTKKKKKLKEYKYDFHLMTKINTNKLDTKRWQVNSTIFLLLVQWKTLKEPDAAPLNIPLEFE